MLELYSVSVPPPNQAAEWKGSGKRNDAQSNVATMKIWASFFPVLFVRPSTNTVPSFLPSWMGGRTNPELERGCINNSGKGRMWPVAYRILRNCRMTGTEYSHADWEFIQRTKSQSVNCLCFTYCLDASKTFCRPLVERSRAVTQLDTKNKRLG